MGVDIGFHIEVRKKNKWIPVVWKLREEIADPYMEYKNVDGWVEIDAIISGRFYHFDDFLESSASRQGLPEDIVIGKFAPAKIGKVKSPLFGNLTGPT